MQVHDVQKSLVSVSRICDARHHVEFLNDGGYIEHERTRQSTEFAREDNVYRLKLHCEKRFSRPWTMNSESTTDEDVVPSSPFADQEMC